MAGGRIDLFTTVHKGLRWWMAEVTSRLGAADFRDATAAGAVLSELTELLDTFDEHALHEDTFIGPFVERRGADRFPSWEKDHRALEHTGETLRRQSAELAVLGARHPNAADIGLGLYRGFNRFASMMLVHLDHEETVLMPLLWSVCTDEDLTELMAGFQARFGTDAARLYARVAPGLTGDERALLGV